MNVAEFKEIILKKECDEVLTEVLLSGDAKHCDEKNRDFIRSTITKNYKISEDDLNLIVVGSAKLGFSIIEKFDKQGNLLKRYRPFRADSDIDLAVVSPRLYGLLWDELSYYSFSQPNQPWDSGRLGDYMVCGWLRPDYFPKKTNLRKCNDWWTIFTFLSAQHRLGRRRVRGGIYYSLEQLKYYQAKGLKDCIEFEKLQE